MKNYNHYKTLAVNLFKEEQQLKKERREYDQNNRQFNLDYDEKSLELQKQEQDLAQRKITVFKEEEKLLLDEIQDMQFPVNINFDGNEDLVADRYIYIKNIIPDVEKKRDKLRAQTLTKAQIILAEFAAMIFFIFILTRLAVDNVNLLEGFVLLTLFRDLYGYSMMTLFADMVAQDYLIVLAISYITAISFKDNDAFYDTKLKTKLLYSFGFFVIGLFVSSMLFSY